MMHLRDSRLSHCFRCLFRDPNQGTIEVSQNEPPEHDQKQVHKQLEVVALDGIYLPEARAAWEEEPGEQGR
eukprot:704782-Amorphochlora_amoeboformis.AAC.1